MGKVKISVAIDEEIHKCLKYKAIEETTTVQQIVEDALKHYLKPEEATVPNPVEASRRTINQTIKKLLNTGDVVVLENMAVALRAIDRMTHPIKPRAFKADKVA